MTKQTLILAALLVASVGCKSEIDGKTAAKVSEPTTAAASTTAPAATAAQKEEAGTTVPFDLTKSKIEWTAAKVTKDHQGGFQTFTGTVTYGPDGSLSAIETEIDTTSVFTDVEKLTKHLKGPDFFDVAKFPKSSFKTTKIVKADDGSYTVTGLLDLHGVTKEISFPATVKREGGNTVATAEFTLLRFDFDIKYKGAPDDLVKPEVLMKLMVVAPEPAES